MNLEFEESVDDYGNGSCTWRYLETEFEGIRVRLERSDLPEWTPHRADPFASHIQFTLSLPDPDSTLRGSCGDSGDVSAAPPDWSKLARLGEVFCAVVAEAGRRGLLDVPTTMAEGLAARAIGYQKDPPVGPATERAARE